MNYRSPSVRLTTHALEAVQSLARVEVLAANLDSTAMATTTTGRNLGRQMARQSGREEAFGRPADSRGGE